MSRTMYDYAERYITLQDCEVVIDGQSFFYQLYRVSGLQSMFGCESDKYAQFLRNYLSKFKKANVKCYFFFKGGHEDASKMWNKNNPHKTEQFKIGKTAVGNVDYKPLIFTKEVYEQVLEEMHFDYVICQYESKRECIAFAQTRNCPIIGFDIEYGFSGVPYISANPYAKKLNMARCKVFTLDNLMRKFLINKEKIAIFIVLTDEYIFPENHFQNFMEAKNIPLSPQYVRNEKIFDWLSRVDSQIALSQIFEYITSDHQTFFSKKKEEVMAFIRQQEKPGLPSQYLESQMNLQFVENDPQWFEKGVVTKAVAIPYVNLYRWQTMPGSWATTDNGASEALLLSLDIIKYALGLLTNFGKDEFKIVRETCLGIMEEISENMPSNFRKPIYNAIESPFENGWTRVRSLGLFEHFLTETLPMFDLTTLRRLPEDARLLVIALVYFSHKKPEITINEVCSVLLSYLVLNVLSDPVDGDTGIDNHLILYADKLAARRNLAEYLDELAEDDDMVIFDGQRIHTVMEFQLCLQHLNFLNRLCGRPYQSTVYSKTYNGTLVHRILFSLTNQNEGTCAFIENKLKTAPTVLAFWNRLIGAFDEIN